MNNENLFGEEILRLRNEKNLTQKELATAVGSTGTSISAIEVGKHLPRPSLMRKLAKFFGYSYEAFRDLTKGIPLQEAARSNDIATRIEDTDTGSNAEPSSSKPGLKRRGIADEATDKFKKLLYDLVESGSLDPLEAMEIILTAVERKTEQEYELKHVTLERQIEGLTSVQSAKKAAAEGN